MVPLYDAIRYHTIVQFDCVNYMPTSYSAIMRTLSFYTDIKISKY